MKLYLSFSLSPVQEFISAARTTRDLWTGSYLLSWLTAHAIHTVGPGNLVLPAVQADNLMIRLLTASSGNEIANQAKQGFESVLIATIPNTFIARVDNAEIAKKCREAVEFAWREISNNVHSKLFELLKDKPQFSGWNAFWNEQVDNYWEIQTTIVDIAEAEAAGQRLMPHLADRFQAGLQYLGRISAAKKQVRRFPLHEIYRDEFGQLTEDSRPKCAMFGSMAQMGPLAKPGEYQMHISGDFWKVVADSWTMTSARVQPKDRLCAVALIKRFFWACYFENRLERLFGKQVAAEFSFPDIDTICASRWLKAHQIDICQTTDEKGQNFWSGHWLRWHDRLDGSQPDRLDARERCPSVQTWEDIRSARKANPVPRYYAALMLDGDKMGRVINRCKTDEDLKNVSSALSQFASDTVGQIVEHHHGKLIYAGGDDVLALMPAENAIACAKELADAFANLRFPKADQRKPSCTVAIVVAHYKQPLHTVLSKLRAGEKIGKTEGGNCLALTIMRRSGEETTNCVPWGTSVDDMKEFVDWFREQVDATDSTNSHEQSSSTFNRKTSNRLDKRIRGETDRWVYRFRQLLNDLPDNQQALSAELHRLLERAELADKTVRKSRFESFHQSCHQHHQHESHENAQSQKQSVPSPKAASLQFAQLIQSASFIARNGEQ
jgi:CRISPR-associated protein Cmr2